MNHAYLFQSQHPRRLRACAATTLLALVTVALMSATVIAFVILSAMLA